MSRSYRRSSFNRIIETREIVIRQDSRRTIGRGIVKTTESFFRSDAQRELDHIMTNASRAKQDKELLNDIEKQLPKDVRATVITHPDGTADVFPLHSVTIRDRDQDNLITATGKNEATSSDTNGQFQNPKARNHGVPVTPPMPKIEPPAIKTPSGGVNSGGHHGSSIDSGGIRVSNSRPAESGYKPERDANEGRMYA